MSNSEVLDIDPKTGEILIYGDEKDFKLVKQSKIKALNLLKREDFVKINGTWEAKKDGLLKILSSLPLSYSWEVKSQNIDFEKGYAMVNGILIFTIGSIQRESEGMGICEMAEFTGNMNYTLHNMNAKAETRAMKRAIDVLFGSVINYYVLTYLENIR
jgi:hypothetical protein